MLIVLTGSERRRSCWCSYRAGYVAIWCLLCIGLMALLSGCQLARLGNGSPLAHCHQLPVKAEPARAWPEVDKLMSSHLRRQGLAGASLAFIDAEGSLHQRSYGCADVDSGMPMPVQARMRVASVSKWISALAAMRMVDQGQLDLDQTLSELLPGLSAAAQDPRVARITPRMLLQHCAGFEHAIGSDPVFQLPRELREQDPDLVAHPRLLLEKRLQQPLNYTPGTHCSYENIGYTLLGEIIAARSGMPYEQAVGELLWQVLSDEPDTWPYIASTLPGSQGSDEPRYHDPRQGASLHSSLPPTVPAAYGVFDLAWSPASGGWVASAAQLVLLADAAHAEDGLLSERSRQALNRAQRPWLSDQPGARYALGRDVFARSGGGEWLHAGDLPGTSALVAGRIDSPLVLALLINASETQPQQRTRLARRLLRLLSD